MKQFLFQIKLENKLERWYLNFYKSQKSDMK